MVVAGVLKNESREQGSGGWPRSNDAGFEIETCGPNRRRLVYLDEFQLVSFLPLESIASDHVGRPEGDAKNSTQLTIPARADITRTSALLFDTVNLDAVCTNRHRAAEVRGA